MPLLIFLLAVAIGLPGQTNTRHINTSLQPTWLWIMDPETGLGVAGAAVDIAPGDKCLGRTNATDVKWAAHYTTDSAGRVLVANLPEHLSCRVVVNEEQLFVTTYGEEGHGPRKGPVWDHLRDRYQASISVTRGNGEIKTQEPDYWETTDNPTLFRSYVMDLNDGALLPDVTVTAQPSGIETKTDKDGLFTLAIPASFRKGKFPTSATQTLVFTKPGYRTFEYRRLVLNPGVRPVTVYLQKGQGTVVRLNGESSPDEFFEIPSSRASRAGEIIALEIRPYTYYAGWIRCTSGSKAVLKGRNLKAVKLYFYSTGTGMGEMPPGESGPMEKVATSGDIETWEISLQGEWMTTNFWAAGIDVNGESVRSMDVGGISCE